MKKIAGILFALLMLPMSAGAQEYYTLPEIREQAAEGGMRRTRSRMVERSWWMYKYIGISLIVTNDY